ncbi:MAG: hypothetical protein HYX81_01815 [Chloroflexi bacterium]|nr:hypothetical protein [Chloroflexota bacterium]
MIIVRRIFAILLALLLVILFVPLMLVYRVNSTVGNPDFYIGQLRKADVYNFLYDSVLPSALKEIGDGETGKEPWFAPYAVTFARQAVPPEWLETQTETIISTVMPYAFGDTDSFVVNIPLKDRVKASAQAIKDALHKPEFTNQLYSQGVDFVTSSLTSGTTIPIPMDKTTVETMIRRVLPPDWLVRQFDIVIDEVTPYFVKEKEHFTVKVNLLERMDDIQIAVTDLLKKREVYDYILNELLAKQIKQNIPPTLEVVPGVGLTGDEIFAVLKEGLSFEWYQSQVMTISGQVFSYLKGTQSTLSVSIAIADQKAALAGSLAKLLDQKLEQKYNSLPLATPEQVQAILTNPPTSGLPPFRLPGVSYADLKKLAGINIETMLAPLLGTAIPDQFSFNETALGLGGADSPLATARELVKQGITLTDTQLQSRISAATLEDIRQRLSGSFTLTEKDLATALSEDGGGQDFEQFRSTMGTIRQVLKFAWLLPLFILGIIGLLGGRQWSTKLIWAAAVLAVAAAITFAAAGPVFSALAQPQIDTALTESMAQATPGSLQALVGEKMVTIAQNAIGDFIGGLRIQSLILLLLSIGLIVLGIIWHRRSS